MLRMLDPPSRGGAIECRREQSQCFVKRFQVRKCIDKKLVATMPDRQSFPVPPEFPIGCNISSGDRIRTLNREEYPDLIAKRTGTSLDPRSYRDGFDPPCQLGG